MEEGLRQTIWWLPAFTCWLSGRRGAREPVPGKLTVDSFAGRILHSGFLTVRPTRHPASGKTRRLVDNGTASGCNGSEDF